MDLKSCSSVRSDQLPTKDLSNSVRCDQLGRIQTCLLSIESVKLEITAGDRERHIYGDIHVNRGHVIRAYCIYHRTSDQAEIVSSQRYLTLCGPRHCVQLPEILYVDLHELDIEGGGAPLPFLRAAFPILLPPYRDSNESFDSCFTGDQGKLTVSMTWLNPSVLTHVKLDLLDVSDPSDAEWLVSGTVTAIQTVPAPGPPGAQIERKLTLLDRPESDPIQLKDVPIINLGYPFLTPAQTIPLDRKFVAAPVRLETDYVDNMNRLILECGGKPDLNPSHLNGEDSFVKIALDLKFKRSEFRCSVAAESKMFVLRSSDEVGQYYYDFIEGDMEIVRRQRRRRIDKKLKVKVMIYSLNDLIHDKDDEVLETTLPLYVAEDEDERQAKRMAVMKEMRLAQRQAKRLAGKLCYSSSEED